MMRFSRTWWRACFSLWLVAAWGAGAALGDVRGDVEALMRGGGDRAAGSAGASDRAVWLANELGKRTGATAQRQAFVLTVPVVAQCTARECTDEAGRVAAISPAQEIVIAPLLPSGAQAAALPGGRLAAGLFYGGEGSLEKWRGHALAGRIVALEASAPATAWQTAASLGAAAIVFLGDGQTGVTDLLHQSTDIPVGIPRFYCDDAAAVARIRSGAIAALELQVHLAWQEKRADNVLCLIPGRQGNGKHEAAWTNQLLVLQARYDGASEVMTRSPGATQALNAALLLDLARQISETPAHRSVLLAFTAGDQWNLSGSNALLDLLNRDVKDPARAVRILQAEADGAANRLASAQRVAAALPRLVEGHASVLRDEATRTAIENQLLRTSSGIEEQLQDARLRNAAAELPALEERKRDILSAMNAVHSGGGGGAVGGATAGTLDRCKRADARVSPGSRTPGATP